MSCSLDIRKLLKGRWSHQWHLLNPTSQQPSFHSHRFHHWCQYSTTPNGHTTFIRFLILFYHSLYHNSNYLRTKPDPTFYQYIRNNGVQTAQRSVLSPTHLNRHQTDNILVLKTPLALFSKEPITGFYRNGYCQVGPEDHGNHAVAGMSLQPALPYHHLQHYWSPSILPLISTANCISCRHFSSLSIRKSY